MAEHNFVIGDRVQLSPDGLKAYRHIAKTKPERAGTIVRFVSHTRLPVVHWDGLKGSEGSGIHPRFLMHVDFARKLKERRDG